MEVFSCMVPVMYLGFLNAECICVLLFGTPSTPFCCNILDQCKTETFFYFYIQIYGNEELLSQQPCSGKYQLSMQNIQCCIFCQYKLVLESRDQACSLHKLYSLIFTAQSSYRSWFQELGYNCWSKRKNYDGMLHFLILPMGTHKLLLRSLHSSNCMEATCTSMWIINMMLSP